MPHLLVSAAEMNKIACTRTCMRDTRRRQPESNTYASNSAVWTESTWQHHQWLRTTSHHALTSAAAIAAVLGFL
jgi:hypothetical protein